MKSLYLALAVVLMASLASAQVPTTPNLLLNKPPFHYQRWDIPNNANWDTLDSLFNSVMTGCGGDGSHGVGWDPVLHFTCVGITGTAAAGGVSGQLQFNNLGALGGFNDGTIHQVLHGTRVFGAVTSLDVDNSVAQTGVDINTSFQVTALHLAAPCPVAMGCTGTATPSLIGGTNVTITGAWPNQTITSIGGAPGGSNKQIQFNDTGVFGGNSALTFNKATGLFGGGYVAGATGPVIDPMNPTYGCAGDGVTDDTTCFQAAVNQMEATGGEIFLGSGKAYVLNRVQLAGFDTIRGYSGISGEKASRIFTKVDAAFVSKTPTVPINSVTITDLEFRSAGVNAIDIPLVTEADIERIHGYDATGCLISLVSGERWNIQDITGINTGKNGMAVLCTGDTTQSLFTGSLTPNVLYGPQLSTIGNINALGSLNGSGGGFATNWIWRAGDGTTGATGGLLTQVTVGRLYGFFSCLLGEIQTNNVTDTHFHLIDLDHVAAGMSAQAIGINIVGNFRYSSIESYNPAFNTNNITTQAFISSTTGATIINSHFSGDNSSTFGLKFGVHGQSVTIQDSTGALYLDPTYAASQQEIHLANSQMTPSNAASGAMLSDQLNQGVQLTTLGNFSNTVAATGLISGCRGAGNGVNGTFPCDFTSSGTSLTVNEATNFKTNPLEFEFTNAAAGTSTGSLVKLINTSGALQVTKTAITDTNNAYGCVQSGAGTSGTAQVATLGVAQCLFDNVAVTDADFVIVSVNTAGTLSDSGSGSTIPTGVLNMGKASGSHAPCGSPPCGPYSVILQTPDALGAAGTGILATPNVAQTIQPSTDVTGLIVKQFNGSNTADTFSVQDKSAQKLLTFNAAGAQVSNDTNLSTADVSQIGRPGNVASVYSDHQVIHAPASAIPGTFNIASPYSSYMNDTAGGSFLSSNKQSYSNYVASINGQAQGQHIAHYVDVRSYGIGDGVGSLVNTTCWGGKFVSGTSSPVCETLEADVQEGDTVFFATVNGNQSTGATTIPFTGASNTNVLGSRFVLNLSRVTSAGTVSGVSGTTVTTSSSPNWTAAAAVCNGQGAAVACDPTNEYFKITSDDVTIGGQNVSHWYKITGVISTTQFTIETNYDTTDLATSGAYQIVQGSEIQSFTANNFVIPANNWTWSNADNLQSPPNHIMSLGGVQLNFNHLFKTNNPTTGNVGVTVNNNGGSTHTMANAYASTGSWQNGMNMSGTYTQTGITWGSGLSGPGMFFIGNARMLGRNGDSGGSIGFLSTDNICWATGASPTCLSEDATSHMVDEGILGGTAFPMVADVATPAVVTIGSGTSISATSLCSTTNCPAGMYDVSVFIDITTACTTTGSYIVWLGWTDDQGAKTGSSTNTFIPINGLGVTQSTGSLALASTSNYAQGHHVIRTTGAATGGLGSINYGTTAGACGTGGPMVGKMYLVVTRMQ